MQAERAGSTPPPPRASQPARASLPPAPPQLAERPRISQPPPLPRESQPPRESQLALRASRPPPLPRDSQVPGVPAPASQRVSQPPPEPPWARSAPPVEPEPSEGRTTLLPTFDLPRSRSSMVPPPPGSMTKVRAPGGEPIGDPALVASVRLDAQGALIDTYGSSDHLAQLVAYVVLVVSLIKVDFALDPFEALHADLLGLRVLIFREAGDILGLLMTPGSSTQDLRQRLGV
jgi:hypothetical protein